MSNVSMIDGHIDEPKITDKEIFKNEILCVKRRSQGVCNGGSECAECDLLMDDVAIISAYKRAIKCLKSQSATNGEEVKHGERYIDADKLKDKFCEACSTKRRYRLTNEECRNWEHAYGNKCFKMRLIDEMSTAEIVEDALEKQIPQKPISLSYNQSFFKHGNCPKCNIFITSRFDWCHGCGQAIDWGE